MFSKKEINYIKELINEMESSLRTTNNFDALSKANKLFGNKIEEIKVCYEEACFNGNIIDRKLNEAVELLKFYIIKESPKNSLFEEVEELLENYPGVKEIYINGLQKYEQNIFERNTLDDMRLSLELLVKKLLRNDKSLENNINEICNFLKEKHIANELRNTFRTLVDYYTKYQNNHVKHDEKVNSLEIEFIMEQTSIMMKFLIRCLEMEDCDEV